MRLEYEIKCYNAKRAPDAESGDSNPKRQKIAGKYFHTFKATLFLD